MVSKAESFLFLAAWPASIPLAIHEVPVTCVSPGVCQLSITLHSVSETRYMATLPTSNHPSEYLWTQWTGLLPNLSSDMLDCCYLGRHSRPNMRYALSSVAGLRHNVPASEFWRVKHPSLARVLL